MKIWLYYLFYCALEYAAVHDIIFVLKPFRKCVGQRHRSDARALDLSTILLHYYI